MRDGERGAKGRRGRRLAAVLLAVALGVFDYRFVLHATASVYGFPGEDFASTLWDFWVVRRQLLSFESPFFTTVLFQGQAASLFYHTLNLLYFAASAPVYLPTGNVFLAFNCSQLLADALGLFCFYRLARQLGGGRGAAVVGAVCFTFCPYKLQRWAALNLQSTWLISLYAFALLKAWRKPGPKRGALLGLSGALLLLGDWHALMFCGLATPFLWAWFVQRYCLPWIDKRRARVALVAVAVALPVVVPYVAIAARHAALTDYAPYNNVLRIHWSASPIYYVMPGWLESKWLEWAGPFPKNDFFSYKAKREWSLFLGVVPIALFLSALARRRVRQDAPLLAGIALFFLISLGPFLVLVHPVGFRSGRLLMLPAYWLFELPVFSAVKHVSRFGVMVLFLALVLGVSRRNLPLLGGRTLTTRTALAVLIVIALHRWDVHSFIPATSVYRPFEVMRRAFATLRPGGFAMVVPGLEWLPEANGLYLQTLHGKTEFYGYLSRQPRGALARARRNRFYSALEVVKDRAAESKTLPAAESKTMPRAEGKALAARDGTAAGNATPSVATEEKPAIVVLIKCFLRDSQTEALTRALSEAYGYRQIYDDRDIRVMEGAGGATGPAPPR